MTHDRTRWVESARESFLTTGDVAPGLPPAVADSWRRSRRCGADAEVPRIADVLAGPALEDRRRSHPLGAAMPLVRAMVGDAAVADGLVVAVGDDAGRLLWVDGTGRARAAADRVGFVPGALWREDAVGTNAPGTALATGRPVRVRGAEHFAHAVHALSCAAAPVLDPRTGATLGVIDVTGGPPAGSRMTVALVQATAAQVARDLARDQAHDRAHDRPGAGGPDRVRSAGPSPRAPVDLDVLGRRPALATPAGPVRLSLRHAEILTLLAAASTGLSAGELAVLLHPGHLSHVAVRAEISRLRRVVGPLLAGSRPYRLARHVRTDADVVRSHLACGHVADAVAAYRAPLLVHSTAPGVERLRADLSAQVRAAALAAGGDALAAWAATAEGGDDHDAWARLARQADPGSPLAVRAGAHLTVLDTLLG